MKCFLYVFFAVSLALTITSICPAGSCKVLGPDTLGDPEFWVDFNSNLERRLAEMHYRANIDTSNLNEPRSIALMAGAVKVSFLDYGYDLDATLVFITKQKTYDFWLRTYLLSGYQKTLYYVVMSIQNQEARAFLIEHEILSNETLSKMDELMVWYNSIDWANVTTN